MRFPLALIAMGLVLMAVASFYIARSGSAAAEVTVTVGDLWFCDPSFQDGVCQTAVNLGDTVIWDYASGSVVHTVTECDAAFSTCPPPGGFDSGLLSPGDTFSRTFDTPGSFPYRCNTHPAQMRGVINVVFVEPTPTPQPTPTPTPTPVPSRETPTPTLETPTPTLETPTPQDLGPATPTPVATVLPAGGSAPSDGGGISSWWYAIMAVGGVLLAGGVFAWRKRMAGA